MSQLPSSFEFDFFFVLLDLALELVHHQVDRGVEIAGFFPAVNIEAVRLQLDLGNLALLRVDGKNYVGL
jgi:hypothetical protein